MKRLLLATGLALVALFVWLEVTDRFSLAAAISQGTIFYNEGVREVEIAPR